MGTGVRTESTKGYEKQKGGIRNKVKSMKGIEGEGMMLKKMVKKMVNDDEDEDRVGKGLT